MILVGNRDLLCGLTCSWLSFWGVNESALCLYDGVNCGLLHASPALHDVRHHGNTSLHPVYLHDEPLRTMPYSHHVMKEVTSLSWNGERIWNFLLHNDVILRIAPFPILCFDQTLGFPGEGPKWAMISANVDSFITNANCLHWEADTFLLQEARIAESNMMDAQRKAGLCNLHVFCSEPLQKIRASNGNYRIPSGGTATCASREVTQLFHADADVSGEWAQLRSTARVTATWHQVSPTVKMLAFTFYAIANAASERAKFERNNELLHQIFTVAAQYGDIPIVLAGDFQMEPGMYPSVQVALDHWGWADPLLHSDEQGIVTRPATFVQHNAVNDDEGQSSIDGILVNRTALTALIGMEVLQHQDRQHRPIRATFAWDRIQQTGTILQKAAKLNLEHVQKADANDPGCPVQILGERLWLTYEDDFNCATTADEKWEITSPRDQAATPKWSLLGKGATYPRWFTQVSDGSSVHPPRGKWQLCLTPPAAPSSHFKGT